MDDFKVGQIYQNLLHCLRVRIENVQNLTSAKEIYARYVSCPEHQSCAYTDHSQVLFAVDGKRLARWVAFDLVQEQLTQDITRVPAFDVW